MRDFTIEEPTTAASGAAGSPAELVAAPGAGKSIRVLLLSAAYGGTAENVTVSYATAGAANKIILGVNGNLRTPVVAIPGQGWVLPANTALTAVSDSATPDSTTQCIYEIVS
jgi:hypothetical protein